MNTLKKFLKVSVVALVSAACLATMAGSAAGFGDNNVIGTNATAPAYILAAAVNGTTTSNLSTVVATKLHDEVGVSIRFRQFDADTSSPTVVFNFGNSIDGTNVDNNATSVHSITLVGNGTNWVQGSTNFYVGTFPYFGGGTVVSSATNAAVTNITIRFEMKDKRNGL